MLGVEKMGSLFFFELHGGAGSETDTTRYLALFCVLIHHHMFNGWPGILIFFSAGDVDTIDQRLVAFWGFNLE